MKAIDKRTLLQLDNLAILYQAKVAGMKIYPEDQFVNYAEIDHELESREDDMVLNVRRDLRKELRSWLDKIADKEDISQDDLDIDKIFQKRILEQIQSTWEYGDRSAEMELQKMQIAANSEVMFFASGGGTPTSRDGTWNDAYEWYEEYARTLSAKAKEDLFVRMQPIILEHIDAGTVRTGLVNSLLDQFAAAGVVRADIIARTESSKAFNWGRRSRFDRSPALAGYRYSAVMDERTTPICRGLHGSSWEIGDPDLDNYTPPNHYRCRSVLVPISKYVDFTFDPVDPDYLDNIDMGETERERAKEMLRKFMDTSYYPKVDRAAAAAGGRSAKTAAPLPSRSDPQPPPPDVDPVDPQEVADLSRQVAINYMQQTIDYNIKRGIREDHPALLPLKDAVKELQSKKYDGKIISAEFDARNGFKVTEYKQQGQVFVGVKGRVKKADQAIMMAEIEKIKNDPLFKGIKIRMENKSKSRLAYYMATNDVMGVTADARGQATLFHEVGHRVHNQAALHDSDFDGFLQSNKINITPDQWKQWQKKADPYWENKETKPGSDLLPEDMYERFAYPINAKYYYSRGTKANFYKEMFAETTSVYLEGDAEWLSKMDRTYPGLIDFMEEVHGRGIK